tara:strand:- start:703 stop:993 length:291 start_codon:yes stop_codon:yes gene_type:complete
VNKYTGDKVKDRQTKRLEVLAKKLKNDLQEHIEVNCSIHGEQVFTIGYFLDTQIVCKACAGQLPSWHKDMLVQPVFSALNKITHEEVPGDTANKTD